MSMAHGARDFSIMSYLTIESANDRITGDNLLRESVASKWNVEQLPRHALAAVDADEVLDSDGLGRLLSIRRGLQELGSDGTLVLGQGHDLDA